MGLRVLLLDDDAMFVEDAKASLTGIGCEVTSLPGGDAGLARATTDRFDLVVVSAELPGVNGFRLCNRMKKDPQVRAVPVILMVGEASAASAEAHRDLATRADVYLQKPVVLAELLAQVSMRVSARKEAITIDDEDVATREMLAAVRFVSGAPAALRARASVGPAGGPPPLPGSPSFPAPPPLPEQRPRAQTVIGVAPPRRTLPPRPSGAVAEATVQRLARDLTDARREAEATAPLRARVKELQESVAQLTRDLGVARAAAASSGAEVEQLRRVRASTMPPPSNPSRDLVALREELHAQAHEILGLRSGLEVEQQQAAEAWERARTTEEANSQLAGRVQRLEEEMAQAEKRLVVAHSERDVAQRRSEESARRAEALAGEIGQTKRKVDEAKTAGAAERAELERLRAVHERGALDVRERTTAAVADRERAHAEQLASLRAENEKRVASEIAAREAAERRVASMHSAHVVELASAQQARDAEVARLRAEAQSDVESLQRELASERERASESHHVGVYDALRADHARALAQAQREAGEEAAQARAEGRASLVVAAERVKGAEAAAHAADERRVREVADAKASAEAAYAKLDHERVMMELQRDAAIADATLELRLAVAKLVEERDKAAANARLQERAEAEKRLEKHREADRDEATAELRIELEGARAAAVAEMRRKHAAELDRMNSDWAKDRADAKARIESTARALTVAREGLEAERRARMEERTAAAARIDALEALAAARSDELAQYRRDAEEVHAEVPALEGEIVMLRTELTEARQKLERQAALAKAADEQIERHRTLLEQARDALGKLLEGEDDEGGS